MPNIYFNQFIEKLNTKTHTLPVALQLTLTQFINDKFSKSENIISDDEKILLTEDLKNELQTFIEHLDTARIGSWILGYQFKSKLPEELRKVFEVAHLSEYAAFNAPNALVSDCENVAAGEGFSASTIYRQVVRLESALVKNEVEERHQPEVQNKIVEWITLLYEKFASMMLEASTFEELNTNFDKIFDELLCKDLPQLKNFHEHVSGQIDFLNNQDFFDAFYKAANLSDKYEFVFEFYQAMKTRPKPLIPEMRATLIHLFYQTVNKAYAPCDAQKFKLMRERGATIEVVFEALQHWTKRNWRQYQETDFHTALSQKLEEEKEIYTCWQKVSDLTSTTTQPRPMYQLHCMKYAGDPNQDPRELLKSIASPVKPKATSRIAPTTKVSSTEPTALPLNTSLLCTDEVFEDEALDSLPQITESKKRKSLNL